MKNPRDPDYTPERIARDEANKPFQEDGKREGRILSSPGGQDFLDRIRKIDRQLDRVQK